MGYMMQKRNAHVLGSGKRASVAIGRLEALQSLSSRPAMAHGLPDDMPFLTFPLKAHEARCLPTSVQNFNFGLGHMELSDRMLMTMRLQLEGTQLYWVAEMTDPELWAAIDMWRRFERLPIGLMVDNGDSWGAVFVEIGFRNKTLRDEIYRAAPQREATAHDWHEMAGLVTGFVQRQASTDIDHIPLQHVFASALLTKQYAEVAGKEPLVKKPVVVRTADGKGGVVLG
ncbi:hypothetical protein BLA39750_00997 [Burkholderia lata]|uniref:Uncharacterized protein n=1 Tax=Burkholderia lata (strain ATCC 17760 / DSM 23089 / LMG 22485 / NCIMB 9086 / R18194 / 383) TaxID=482957 RepID=A0A6P2VFK8_BURL3|nr:hypothetical protein [Burkholderia lata]VWC77763.1 hypothetical protein BLA39750_00997 [Burkholderia lata]